MKVICINGVPKHQLALPIPEGVPLEADQCYRYSDCYIIEGYEYAKNGAPVSHTKCRFIPLSDIDETELVNTKEEVYV